LKFITEREREKEKQEERKREKERNPIFIIPEKEENSQSKYFSNKTLSSGHGIHIAMVM